MLRRKFIKQGAGLALGIPAISVAAAIQHDHTERALDKLAQLPPREAATEEEAWEQIAAMYNPDESFLNLENGYFSMCSVPVMESFMQKTRSVNSQSSFYMRRMMQPERSLIKSELALFCGVQMEEIALTRNTTESLNILIQGIDLKAGDEVLLSKQDYGSMQEAFEQKAKRQGVVLKYVEIPLLPKSANDIVKAYEKSITSKTKMMLVTHMINLTGQILPVKELCALGKAKNIEVIVDGAHAFAHLDFKISDLGCDYYAASLHKWLGAPLGTGFLYVRQNKVATIWPLMGDTGKEKNSIEKLEHTGTTPPANYLSIKAAIDFNLRIGLKRKEERLRYLKNYWTGKLKSIKGVSMLTPEGIEQSCGIACFSIENIPATVVSNRLYDEHRIFTVAIETDEVKGVRVTPHLFTTTEHLDRFVQAVQVIAGENPAPAATPKKK
ncbi:MAG: aminotransferase class V-fold PLP-dependent enzyme [Bacteroidia bacterium]